MKIEINNNFILFKPNSKIDGANAKYVYETITSIMNEREIYNCILDLNDVDYVSSSGLRILISLAKTAVENGSELLVIRAMASVKKIMASTGITKIIKLAKNEIEEIEYIQRFKSSQL